MLSIQVPSIYPDKCEKMINSWYETGMDAYSFLTIFAQGYDPDMLGQRFGVKMVSAKLRAQPSMFSLRDSIAMYCSSEPRNHDYYMMTDDNVIFKKGAGQYFRDCLAWMDNHPEAGFMACAGHFGSYSRGSQPHLSNSIIWNIDKGLIIRSSLAPFPSSALKLKGGLEDLVSCYWIIENGYLPAKRFQAPVYHVGMPMKDRLKSSSYIHDWNVWENNAIAYIRARYDDPDWNFPMDRTTDKRRYPKLIKEKMNALQST